MKKVVEGSQAVSEAARLARVEVIAAYPITPQTHIVEALSEYCSNGTLNARFINVESEHSAMAAVIGASSGGARAFTASSSHGLAYMHEMLHWASAARLPIVMAEVNRALGPGWNIWTDQTDSLAQRDTGWIQLYCEDGQEALDTTLQAFRLAEALNLPVMVVLYTFFLSHTFEPIDVPDQQQVDRFLPSPYLRLELDTAAPNAFNQLVTPAAYMEMRGDTETTVLSWAGDGGTFDIGFQSLSGAVERNEDCIFVCYDNEAYMNTGVQRSSATPYGAQTTTSPAQKWKNTGKKNIVEALAAHRIPYAATASIGYPEDMIRKFEKAKKITGGSRFLHVFAPCPTGWRIGSEMSVQISRLAVQTNVFPLYEVEGGVGYTLNFKGDREVKEYLTAQGRFKQLADADCDRIQQMVNAEWKLLLRKAGLE